MLFVVAQRRFPTNIANITNITNVYSTKNLGVKPNQPTNQPTNQPSPNLHPTFYIVYLSMVKVGYTGCVIGNPTSDTNLTFTHPTIPPSAHPHAIRRICYNEVLHNGREVGDVDPPGSRGWKGPEIPLYVS